MFPYLVGSTLTLLSSTTRIANNLHRADILLLLRVVSVLVDSGHDAVEAQISRVEGTFSSEDKKIVNETSVGHGQLRTGLEICGLPSRTRACTQRKERPLGSRNNNPLQTKRDVHIQPIMIVR